MSNSKKNAKSFFFSLILFLVPGIGFAQESKVLFSADFESTLNGNPSPVWSWKEPYSSSNPFGMMLGAGDIYSLRTVDVGQRKSGVLSLNFDGRNGFCNTCGWATHNITSEELQNNCVSVNGGPFGDKLFNKSRGFSTWSVTRSDTQVTCFEQSALVENSLFGDNAMEVGDELKLPFQCGLNGTVGNNIDRRSDCDLAINYLKNIDIAHFKPGMTLARRMYLYIPNLTETPNWGLKLGYTTFQFPSGGVGAIIPVFKTSRDETLEVEGGPYFNYQFPGYKLTRNTWHYIEEVWVRESSEERSDGTYKIYAGVVGTDTTTPLLTVTGIQFGQIKNLSIIGNWQHLNDAVGNIYIDNVMVANEFIGQGDTSIDQGELILSAPSAPEIVEIQ
jgi:hypothetical protein